LAVKARLRYLLLIGSASVSLRGMKKSLIARCVTLAGVALISGNLFAGDPAAEMAEAANKFLASLKADQKAKASYPLKGEDRYRWHFIPTEMVKGGRTGLSMIDMDAKQRDLAKALLKSATSGTGYKKATQIMMLEGILRASEKNGKLDRNPILYFVSIFGEPSATGTNLAEVTSGKSKGLRVLAKEEDLARELVKSLDASQRELAVFDKKAPRDILSGANRKAEELAPKGLGFGKLNAQQKKALQALVREYVFRSRTEVAKADLANIAKEGWDKVHFAWAGGFEKGEGHYYRIQGPSFMLEYANTQNDAHHVHAAWREFHGDYGDDLLAKHFANDHK
jgi:hypothetical protein